MIYVVSGLRLVVEYALLFAAIYAVTLIIYFTTGLALTWVNRRYPERRIQPTRDGRHRIRREIHSSMKALATSCGLLTTGFFAQINGWTLAPLDATWWSVPLMFAVSMVLYDAWFYWGHRLLHLPAFYRFHAPHHASLAPTPWSNDSSTTVDTLIEHGYYLVIWFVLPIPAVALFAQRLFDQISGMIGHAGFEYFASPTSRWPWPFICTSFHDLHHSRFHYNFGNFFSLWDRMMGTVDPRYDDMVKTFEETPVGGKPSNADMGGKNVG
ncbi:sterol desaturase family protein [Breoghania sp.]|uniref:sterol desaturase family protein n=1 Tax=Breoghania sp. TaxID=2065378 RepID=UPI0029CA07B8|nr:sterol desaturase family protein [Breoghania sp.]